nr:hypothetical protein [Tanacetum cinerariifolium]
TAMECMSIQLLFTRQVTLRDRKRGHVYWKCTSKERSTKIQERNMPSPVMTEVQERINYPERVHVTTYYMVKGSDKGN